MPRSMALTPPFFLSEFLEGDPGPVVLLGYPKTSYLTVVYLPSWLDPTASESLSSMDSPVYETSALLSQLICCSCYYPAWSLSEVLTAWE